MKILLKWFFQVLFLIVIIPSCELLEECKTCKLVTEEDGNSTEAPGILFCSKELKKKENSTPITEGSTTNYWLCK